MATKVQVKANKRAGHQAEGEMGKRTSEWPTQYHMVRTGLDGSHDLRGEHAIGEVKKVRVGPAWLKSALSQLDNASEEHAAKDKFIFVKLSQGAGHPTRWLIAMDLGQFEAIINA